MLVNNEEEAIWRDTNKDDSSNFNLKFANLKKKFNVKYLKPIEINTNTYGSNQKLPCSGNPTPTSINLPFSPSMSQTLNKYKGSFHFPTQKNFKSDCMIIDNSPLQNIAKKDKPEDFEEIPELLINKINSITTNNNDLTSIENSIKNSNFRNKHFTDVMNRSLNLKLSLNPDEDNLDTEEYFLYNLRLSLNKCKTLSGKQPKFLAENLNMSSRFSTKESNESFDSQINNVKCNYNRL